MKCYGMTSSKSRTIPDTFQGYQMPIALHVMNCGELLLTHQDVLALPIRSVTLVSRTSHEDCPEPHESDQRSDGQRHLPCSAASMPGQQWSG